MKKSAERIPGYAYGTVEAARSPVSTQGRATSGVVVQKVKNLKMGQPLTAEH
jgi:hypothetical protein